ncbi:signal peptidase I [Pseudarthrobacter sp. RMG13]|uniref:Signal peptidase I n=1 Tax=Pseudarthrobacter humi TaxID=2952523 RepID=A0ABT1LLS4_9MICC|nr:signal peptidase I [Pseudarthrobacter humi]MCP8998151.1 signal peptidase I [Pseudarthrobacter humi]
MRRAFWVRAVAIVAFAGWLWLAWPAALGGQTTYLSTFGDSMEPQFRAGDLGILRPAERYDVGDVVAYRSDLLQTMVLHRIVSIEDGHYTFQGDNNPWLDPEQPTRDQLIGELAVQIPQGGLWLERLTSPPVLGVIAFALVAGGGTAATTRKLRKKRRSTVSRHISDRPAMRLSAGGLSAGILTPSLRIPAAVLGLLGIVGTALGAAAWAGPLDAPSSAEVKSGTSMKFSYTADVGRTAAYDGTTATSPDPIFRKLANRVDVTFTYEGDPGTVAVAAELTSPSGWHSTVPLAGPESFTGNGYEGTVTLDLNALEDKAEAAAAVTGVSAAPVSIALMPQVTTESGAEFMPKLPLNLTPLQLSLTGGEQALTVTDSATSQQTILAPRTIGLNGWNITAATARAVSAVLLLAVIVAGTVLLVRARRAAPLDEATGIRRRYSSLLVRVHPMTAPQGRPVIDVTSFATLAKLAERYGLLVLHWNRSGVETFIVQDESATYRYRAAGGRAAGAESDQAKDENFFMDADSPERNA